MSSTRPPGASSSSLDTIAARKSGPHLLIRELKGIPMSNARQRRRNSSTPSTLESVPVPKASILDSMMDRAIRELLPRSGPEHKLLSSTRPCPTPPRRDFALEPLEPRLLMSADISYASLNPNHDFTLRATD